VPRVRFVNYYTACWGRPKKEKAEILNAEGAVTRSLTPSPTASLSRDQSPRVSVEGVRSNEIMPMAIEPEKDIHPQGAVPEAGIEAASLPSLDITTTKGSIDSEAMENTLLSGNVNLPIWPPLSPLPTEPVAPDYSVYPEKVVQDALKKEHERRVKSYKQAMKDREATLVERKKVEDKILKAAAKEAEKKIRLEEREKKDVPKMEPERNSARRLVTLTDQSPEGDESATAVNSVRPVVLPVRPRTSPQSGTPRPSESDNKHSSASGHPLPLELKKMKDKHFCILPPKDDVGERDPTWVRVFMEDMDEVTAHTSLFFLSDAYERLVGDVGAQIEEWIRETTR
jgi:hypothetical protein